MSCSFIRFKVEDFSMQSTIWKGHIATMWYPLYPSTQAFEWNSIFFCRHQVHIQMWTNYLKVGWILNNVKLFFFWKLKSPSKGFGGKKKNRCAKIRPFSRTANLFYVKPICKRGVCASIKRIIKLIICMWKVNGKHGY